jgi:hypothetical protein
LEGKGLPTRIKAIQRFERHAINSAAMNREKTIWRGVPYQRSRVRQANLLVFKFRTTKRKHHPIQQTGVRGKPCTQSSISAQNTPISSFLEAAFAHPRPSPFRIQNNEEKSIIKPAIGVNVCVPKDETLSQVARREALVGKQVRAFSPPEI